MLRQCGVHTTSRSRDRARIQVTAVHQRDRRCRCFTACQVREPVPRGAERTSTWSMPKVNESAGRGRQLNATSSRCGQATAPDGAAIPQRVVARGPLVTSAIIMFLQDVPRFVDALMSLVAAGDVSFQQNCRDVARADSLLGLRQRVQEKLRGRSAAGARK